MLPAYVTKVYNLNIDTTNLTETEKKAVGDMFTGNNATIGKEFIHACIYTIMEFHWTTTIERINRQLTDEEFQDAVTALNQDPQYANIDTMPVFIVPAYREVIKSSIADMLGINKSRLNTIFNAITFDTTIYRVDSIEEYVYAVTGDFDKVTEVSEPPYALSDMKFFRVDGVKFLVSSGGNTRRVYKDRSLYGIVTKDDEIAVLSETMMIVQNIFEWFGNKGTDYGVVDVQNNVFSQWEIISNTVNHGFEVALSINEIQWYVSESVPDAINEAKDKKTAVLDDLMIVSTVVIIPIIGLGAALKTLLSPG